MSGELHLIEADLAEFQFTLAPQLAAEALAFLQPYAAFADWLAEREPS